MNKWHGSSLQPYNESLTLRVFSEPTAQSGGDYLRGSGTDFTVRGIFIPDSTSFLDANSFGHIIQSSAEVQISKAELDGAGISAAVGIQQVVRDGRAYTVMNVEDYSNRNGMFLLNVVAEVDKDTY